MLLLTFDFNDSFGTVGPSYQALPSFLERVGHRNPTNEIHTAFHDGWNTSVHPFAWFADKPDHLAYFNDYMALRRKPELSWLTVYPVEEEAQDISPERALYVNIGGGVGHQCAQFKEKYPNIPGRVILQDMPHSIAEALPTPEVENIAHDFFQPQPISGKYISIISHQLSCFLILVMSLNTLGRRLTSLTCYH